VDQKRGGLHILHCNGHQVKDNAKDISGEASLPRCIDDFGWQAELIILPPIVEAGMGGFVPQNPLSEQLIQRGKLLPAKGDSGEILPGIVKGEETLLCGVRHPCPLFISIPQSFKIRQSIDYPDLHPGLRIAYGLIAALKNMYNILPHPFWQGADGAEPDRAGTQGLPLPC